MTKTIHLIVSFFSSRKCRLLSIGTLFAIIGIVLVTSFQFITDHRWYWGSAPFICLIAILTSTSGGLLIGTTISKIRSGRISIVIIGAVLCFVWIAAGILASILSALGMYELPSITGPIGWDTYSNSFLFSGAHIRFLQIAVGTGFLGCIALGPGLIWRRVPMRITTLN